VWKVSQQQLDSFLTRIGKFLYLFSPKDSLFYFDTAIIFWTIFLLGQWKHMKNVPNHFANLSLEIAHEDDGMMWWKIIFLELFLYVVLEDDGMMWWKIIF